MLSLEKTLLTINCRSHMYLYIILVTTVVTAAGGQRDSILTVTDTKGVETTYFSIEENVPYNTLVGLITSSDHNNKLACAEQQTEKMFEMEGLDRRTVGVYIKGFLDREMKDSYIYSVMCGGSGKQEALKLKVKVLDVNDSPPQFEKQIYTSTIWENTPVGTLVLKVSATDRDEGRNGNVVYSMESQRDEKLTINSETGEIRTTVMIDYEQIHSLKLKVKASDKGVSPIITVAQIVVKINDVNDNAPQFSQRMYSCTLMKKAKPGTIVIQVQAFDADSQRNGMVTYRLKTNLDGLFTIEARTGTISTTRTTDHRIFGSTGIVKLQVTATDQGTPPMITTVDVNVYNYHRTNLGLQFKQSKYEVSIKEHMPVGVSLLQATAARGDTGGDGNIEYSLTGENKAMVIISPHTGQIFTMKRMDRESVGSEINLKIHAKYRTMSTSVPLVIHVLDINDHTPIFSQSVYSVSLFGSSPIGYSVAQVMATDVDSGENGRITYSLLGDGKRWFAVDATRGVITVVDVLDKAHNLVQFSVVAADHGYPIRKATASVGITVKHGEGKGSHENTIINKDNQDKRTSSKNKTNNQDKNTNTNNAPVFAKKNYKFSMLEYAPNMEKYIQFGRVVAHDVDGDTITYSISGNQRVQEWFGIGAMTGILSIKSAESYQVLAPGVEFKVYVTDNGSPIKTDHTQVTMTISQKRNNSTNPGGDINTNNAPIFIQQIYQFKILEKMPAGTFVGTVTVSDSNGDDITMTIGAIGQKYFKINFNRITNRNITTGVIRVSKPGNLAQLLEPKVNFTVNVSDNSSPAKVSTALITVIIVRNKHSDNTSSLKVRRTNDVLQNNTVVHHHIVTAHSSYLLLFDATTYHFEVDEDAPVGQCIGRVSIQNMEEHSIRYSLEVAERFAIDAHTGELCVAYQPQCESQDIVQVIVMATNDRSPPLNNKTIVNITVL